MRSPREGTDDPRAKGDPDELARHTAVAAMKHADDDFLADVTALGQADRAILDPGFEWNRVFVHVDMKKRPPAFDATNLRRGGIDIDGASSAQRLHEIVLRLAGRTTSNPITPMSSLTST